MPEQYQNSIRDSIGGTVGRSVTYTTHAFEPDWPTDAAIVQGATIAARIRGVDWVWVIMAMIVASRVISDGLQHTHDVSLVNTFPGDPLK